MDFSQLSKSAIASLISGTLRIAQLVFPRVPFKGSVAISDFDDLPEIDGQKSRDQAMLLILMHMPKLMRQQPARLVTSANEDRIPKREPDHSGAKQAGLRRCLAQA